MNEQLSSGKGDKLCSKCGNSFVCQPENISACLCSAVSLSDEERKYIALKFEDCLCNNCLLFVKEEYEKLPLYYFENGLMVMTEKYHVQRGGCCQSGCRHCPYK